VNVSGISKGKGFQGVMKRHGFHGRASVSHGTKHELRTPGSTGSSMPEHVAKGKKMAGHMGVERVTVKNLKIMKVDQENNLLAIEGALPGRKGTLLEIIG
jgi:large subunit ribosomal protein L3